MNSTSNTSERRFIFQRFHLHIQNITAAAFKKNVSMKERTCEVIDAINFIEFLVVKSLIDALLSSITVKKWGLSSPVFVLTIIILILGVSSLYYDYLYFKMERFVLIMFFWFRDFDHSSSVAGLLQGNIFGLLDLLLSNGIGVFHDLDIMHLFYFWFYEKLVLLIVHFIYYNSGHRTRKQSTI